jgi:small subunit ribosomal protein S20
VANTKSAQKRVRSTARKRTANRIVRSETRTSVKKARLAVESGDATAATSVSQAVALLDKLASKGIIHRRNAARHKSRLMRALHSAQQQNQAE